MPIYEYRCAECHQVFEEWCKHVEDSNKPRNCPICKGQSKRLISHTSFALKGSGWYATDYGAHKDRPAADSESGLSAPEDIAPVPGEEKKTAVPTMASGG